MTTPDPPVIPTLAHINVKALAVRADRDAAAYGLPDSQIVTGSLTFTVLAAAPTAIPDAPPTVPVAPVVVARWQLEDPVLNEIYAFPINPKTSESPEYIRTINETVTTTGRPITHEGSRVVPIWTIGGHVSSQAMHDALVHWSRKTNKIYITDDLARTWIVYIQEFQHLPRLGQAIWEGNYSMKLFVYQQVVR